MKLAHFSDIHVTLSPLGAGPGLSGKRLAGTANYYVGGRGRHFRGAEGRIERLLADVDRSEPDHVLCTGDVTQMSWPEEFRRAASLFGARLDHPELYTVLPGNHDRYTKQASEERWFEAAFGAVAPPSYPFVKPLDHGRVHLVAVDVTRPAGLVDSSGELGEKQRAKLEAVLTDPKLADTFNILTMHYGLRKADGRPDGPRHGIRDYRALEALLARPEVRVDLVLHGHMHRPYALPVSGRRVICVGSGTDLATGGGWHLLDIHPESRQVQVRRRVWSEPDADYVDAPGPIRGFQALESNP